MAKSVKNENKPRLQNLDEMFGLDGSETPTTLKNGIASIEIEKLSPFKTHPFRLYEGERLDDMVASVNANGVLIPIIVRKVEETLEILAGHNRVNAAKLAGLTEIPTIILEDISDDDAMVYVIETNLLQRSFSDMTHTEKAAVIALHHSKMFSQGKRNDILEQLKMLEKPHEYKDKPTFPQVGEKLNSVKKVGEMYSLSKNTVSRYIRIQQLISALKIRLDNDDFSFIPAVTLSFLKAEEQKLLENCLEQNGFTIDMKKADMLRKYSEESKLNGESVYQILSGEAKPKQNLIPTVKISNIVYSKYFKPNQPVKEIQGIVEKALEMYFSQSGVSL